MFYLLKPKQNSIHSFWGYSQSIHEPDWYADPHGAHRHTLRPLDNFVSSLFGCVNKVLSATGAQRSLIVSGEFREGFSGHMSYELGPGGWLST